jgi:hypothetical protein
MRPHQAPARRTDIDKRGPHVATQIHRYAPGAGPGAVRHGGCDQAEKSAQQMLDQAAETAKQAIDETNKAAQQALSEAIGSDGEKAKAEDDKKDTQDI